MTLPQQCEEIGISPTEVDNVYTDYEGYKFNLTPDNIKVIHRRKSSPAKFFRNNPYTIDNIKLYIKNSNKDIELISESITNATSKHKYKCSIHGEFIKSWNEIKNGQFCPQCGVIEGMNSRKHDIEFVRGEFVKRGLILVSVVYVNNETPLEYICEKHKNIGSQFMTWGNFISNKGCYHCGRESTIQKQTKTHKQFECELLELFGSQFAIKSKYAGTNQKVSIYCIFCDITFSSKACHLLAGHMGCKCKQKSIGEDRIKEYLDLNDITYIWQYRFSDCRNIKPLPFDFAVFSNNELLFVIEFQGKQHYSSEFGFSSDESKSKESFEKQIKNDQIKRDYCKQNNIRLVEIPYWHMNKIETILDDALKVYNIAI